jgi:hypothetical protein
MFYNRRLAEQVSDDEGEKRRAGEMNYVRRSDFPNEIYKAGLAYNTIWQLRIIHTSRGSLRQQRNFDSLSVLFA